MRIALADDSALFRQGLALLLRTTGVEVVAEVANGDDLLRCIADDPPDVVVLDLRMPPTFSDEGLVTAERVQRRHPQTGVLLLSTYAEPAYADRLLGRSARGVGYLLKDRVQDAATLTDTLRRVSAGESVVDPEIVDRLLERRQMRRELDRLTERERSVLRLMAEGRSNRGIAQALHLSGKTVEAHVAATFGKLDLPAAGDDNRRVLAVLTWLRAGPAPPAESP